MDIMRRKKDDKRVLRSGNGRNQSSGRKIRRRNKNRQRISNRQPMNNRRKRQKRKSNRSLVLVMIMVLMAFVIGAGIGVTLSLDNGDDADDGPHFENVTKEMTKDLNDTEEVYFEKNVDDVDYNENMTSQLNIEYQNGD